MRSPCRRGISSGRFFDVLYRQIAAFSRPVGSSVRRDHLSFTSLLCRPPSHRSCAANPRCISSQAISCISIVFFVSIEVLARSFGSKFGSEFRRNFRLFCRLTARASQSFFIYLPEYQPFTIHFIILSEGFPQKNGVLIKNTRAFTEYSAK